MYNKPKHGFKSYFHVLTKKKQYNQKSEKHNSQSKVPGNTKIN